VRWAEVAKKNDDNRHRIVFIAHRFEVSRRRRSQRLEPVRVLSPRGDTNELAAEASFSTTSSGGSFLTEERAALSLDAHPPTREVIPGSCDTSSRSTSDLPLVRHRGFDVQGDVSLGTARPFQCDSASRSTQSSAAISSRRRSTRTRASRASRGCTRCDRRRSAASSERPSRSRSRGGGTRSTR
jgi:hypothetical protein